MSILSRLFGKAPKPAETSIDYNGFRIIPDPIRDGGKFRIAARIEKEVDGQLRTHSFIRADVLDSHDDCVAATVRKAQQMIDQMGNGIFA